MLARRWLWEATNGWYGEAYLRCYVWAENEPQAKELAAESFRMAKLPVDKIELELLMRDVDNSFATKVSASGWER